MSDPIKDPKAEGIDKKVEDDVWDAASEEEVADADLEGATGGTFTVLSLGESTPIDADAPGKPRKSTRTLGDSL